LAPFFISSSDLESGLSSSLVCDQTALFLTQFEDDIEVMEPANTELVPDLSPTYKTTLFCLESMRRRSVAND